MKLNYFYGASATILSGFLTLVMPGAEAAESLAGKVGNKRFPIQLTGGPKDECSVAYKEYVAASGHSAFAMTSTFAQTEPWYVVCGVRFNAASQKIAEETALASCKSVLKRYKFKIVGTCQVAASK